MTKGFKLRQFALFIFTLTAAFVLVACGNDGGKDNDEKALQSDWEKIRSKRETCCSNVRNIISYFIS